MSDFSLPDRFLRRARADLPPAVVVGVDVTGLTVARALARHGIPVLGIDEVRRGYLGYSSTLEFLQAPSFYDEGLIRFLERVAAALPQRAMLVLTMDEHVKLVGRAGQHLRELYHFDFPDADAVDCLIDKQRFTEYALAHGLPIPGTANCDTEADVRRVGAEFSMPVVLKPRIKNLESRMYATKKAYVCRTPDELLAGYRELGRWEPQVLVQEWIPGGDGDIHFSFHYLDASGRDVATFEGRKLRQFIPECGVTASAVGVPTSAVTERSREILREAGARGFCSMEYKRDPRTGRYYIIEPTVGRVDLQLGVAMANDVDIVSRAYFHCIGRPYPIAESPTHHVTWIRAAADFKAARFYVRRGDFSWSDYVRSIKGPRRFAVWGVPDGGLVKGWMLVHGTRAVTLPYRAARRVVRIVRRRMAPAGA